MKRALLVTFAALLLGGLVLACYTVFIEPDRLVVRHLSFASPRWPAERPPLKVVVLADIHAGAPHIDGAKLDEIVRRANAEAPDLTLLLGDYVIQGVLGGTFIAPEVVARHLAVLHARLGVVAVLGNHDWWLDGERVRQAFEAAGITVLENETIRLGEEAAPLQLAGLADDTTRTPDGKRTFAGVAADVPLLVAMHDPAALDQVGREALLSFAGHTHGGQIHLPWLFDPVTPGRAGPDLAYGLRRSNGKWILVSGGIGTSILPVRLNMPPEILVLTLAHDAR